jgi:hypothetical protein
VRNAVRIEDVKFSEAEIEAMRPYAAYLNLTLEETASLLVEVGFRQVVADLGAESIEEADPEEIARYLLEETEVDDA